MTTLLEGILYCTFFALIALVVFAVVHQNVPVEVREAHNDVAGFIYAILGVLVTVLLAFVVVAVWQRFDDASATAQREANAVIGIYDLAPRVPEPIRGTLDNLTLAYAQDVIDEEWSLMAIGRESPQAWDIMRQMRETIGQFTPVTPADQVIYDHLQTQYRTLADERRLRLLASREGLNPILWILLILGAGVAIGFSYLFGVRNYRAHAGMVTALTITMTSLIFMVGIIDLPFTGDVRVQPDAFEAALRAFAGL
jgi:hypothetical protein